ncbi:MAG TPA: hypothetical protein VKB78_11765 [Pirellulales bacterium]|nr:hypothetical protein [Pirellulales bacterium]
MPLSKADILAADDLPREVVRVPEWGGDVLVRTMTGAERDRFERDFLNDRATNIRARTAAATVCDDTGARLFTDAEAAELGEKSAAALDRIFDAAMRLNRITKRDVDDLEKNLETTPSGNGHSDSPALSV